MRDESGLALQQVTGMRPRMSVRKWEDREREKEKNDVTQPWILDIYFFSQIYMNQDEEERKNEKS